MKNSRSIWLYAQRALVVATLGVSPASVDAQFAPTPPAPLLLVEAPSSTSSLADIEMGLRVFCGQQHCSLQRGAVASTTYWIVSANGEKPMFAEAISNGHSIHFSVTTDAFCENAAWSLARRLSLFKALNGRVSSLVLPAEQKCIDPQLNGGGSLRSSRAVNMASRS